jgi:hypothetical protein
MHQLVYRKHFDNIKLHGTTMKIALGMLKLSNGNYKYKNMDTVGNMKLAHSLIKLTYVLQFILHVFLTRYI